MTYHKDCTLLEEFLEQLAIEGLEGLPEMVRIVINEAMKLERQKYLRAGPYERTPERCGQANGFKPKTVKTRVGEIAISRAQQANRCSAW